MKKLFKTSLYVCCFASFIQSCGPNDGPKDETTQLKIVGNCVMSFENEDSINLIPHEMHDTIAEKLRTAFSNSTTSGNSAPENLVGAISSSAFCSLKDSAEIMHSRFKDCKNYITGLQIIYGLSKDLKKMELLFKPVYLCKTNDSATTDSIHSYSLHKDTVYYRYDTFLGEFKSTTDTSYIEKYRTSIRIDGNTFQHHLKNDTLCDVKSLVFSFQEIAELIKKNNNTPNVKIWNALEEVRVISEGTTKKKHVLLLSDSNHHFISAFSLTDLAGKYANLSHLCPPSCNTLKYKMLLIRDNKVKK